MITYLRAEVVDCLWREAAATESRECVQTRIIPIANNALFYMV